MKKSNRVLTILVVSLIAGACITDYLLAASYSKTDPTNVFRNFDDVTVKPFRYLNVSGGNGYSVEIRHDAKHRVQLLQSRKSFFNMKQVGDTLIIEFKVANRNRQQQYDPVKGLILSAPELSAVFLAGTSTRITGFEQNTLLIAQSDQTSTKLFDLHLHKLTLVAEKSGVIYCAENNHTDTLNINLQNTATLFMNGISFEKFQPRLSDSAALVLGKKNLSQSDIFK